MHVLDVSFSVCPLQVLDASGFKGSDADDLPDTYIVLSAGSTRLVSRICRKELRPCWKEAFLLRPDEVAVVGRVLVLELWAVRRWGADALLGQVGVAIGVQGQGSGCCELGLRGQVACS